MNRVVHVELVMGDRVRLAFRSTSAAVRLHIPGNVIGSYLLFDRRRPAYVGRSDTCLRRRLEGHPLLGPATHVAWEAASSPDRAFLIEAFWFHELRSDARVRNLAHPARPAGSARRCPYRSAGQAERKALLRALRADTNTHAAHGGVAHLTADISTATLLPVTGGSGKTKGHCNG